MNLTDQEIDAVVQFVVRKIELERRQRADRDLDPEAGITRTERRLIEAMLGRVGLDDLVEEVCQEH